MPRDSRLYMTFPIDIHRHPKLQRLPPDVRWTFIEMNGEARIAMNDGRFPEEEAEFMWSRDHLEALLSSHPTRPLVEREDGLYVIRDYAEHQLTRAEQERLAAVSRANGQKGGRPKKNPEGTQQKPKQVSPGTQPQPSRTRTKAESESEDLSTYVSESRPVATARETTDSIELSKSVQTMASQMGITGLAGVIEVIRKHTSLTLEPLDALAVCRHLLDKAAPSGPVRVPQRYVIGAVARSPAEVEKFIYDSGLAA